MHRGVLWVFVFVLGRCRVFVGTRLALWLWLVASFCVLSFCLPRYPGDVGTCGPAHYNQGTEFRRNSLPWLLPGYGVDEPETGIEGGDWCQTRPMGLTKGGLPPFSRLPGTLVRLPVEIRSKTALFLCPLPGVAYKEGTVGTSQRVPAPTRAAGCGHHDHE